MSPTRANSRGSTSSPPAVTRIGAGPSYRVPLVGAAVSARLVETGFWGGLVGAAMLGAIDPPLALLVGTGVAVARHRRS